MRWYEGLREKFLKVLFVIIVLNFVIFFGVIAKDMVFPAKAVEKNGVDKIIYASPEKSCTCPIDIETVDRLIEISELAKSKGDSFEHRAAVGIIYDELVSSGKIILVKRDNKVTCYYSEKYKGFVPVIFLEGELKGKRVYVLEKRLQ